MLTLNTGTTGECSGGRNGCGIAALPQNRDWECRALGLFLQALETVQEATRTLRFFPLQPLESDPCSLQRKSAFGKEEAQSLGIRHGVRKGCQQTCLVLGGAQGYVRAGGPHSARCWQPPVAAGSPQCPLQHPGESCASACLPPSQLGRTITALGAAEQPALQMLS